MDNEYTNEDNQQVYPDMKERGIYKGPSEEDFVSEKEVKRKALIKGDMPVMETPLPVKRDWEYWSDRFVRKEKEWKEISPYRENHVKIRLPDPSLISFIGDQHVGNPWTLHERIKQEIDLVRSTDNSFVVMGGDVIDGFFFTPASMEAIEQPPQQLRYMRAMVEELGEEGKLLVAWAGDHDGWGKKMGFDPYVEFAEKIDAYFMHGVGHITFKIGDNEVRVTAAHKLPGSSIYNRAHPEIRASKEVQGADIYVGFHNHKKAHLEQSIQMFGDKARWIHACAAGPYKTTDEYSRKHGWMRQQPEELFGFAFEMTEGGVVYKKDIVEAHRDFTS